MNTIVINKILMHMLDFEHRKIYHSTDFVDMNETSIDYYRKKVEKALNSPSLKELTVGSLHEMMLRSEKMIEKTDAPIPGAPPCLTAVSRSIASFSRLFVISGAGLSVCPS